MRVVSHHCGSGRDRKNDAAGIASWEFERPGGEFICCRQESIRKPSAFSDELDATGEYFVWASYG